MGILTRREKQEKIEELLEELREKVEEVNSIVRDEDGMEIFQTYKMLADRGAITLLHELWRLGSEATLKFSTNGYANLTV